MERLLLPVTDLRAADTYNLSTATLLREGRGLLFYHTKVALLNHVLNHTAHRGAEDSPPEVSLDPLEALEGEFVRIKYSDQHIVMLLPYFFVLVNQHLFSILPWLLMSQIRPESLHINQVVAQKFV